MYGTGVVRQADKAHSIAENLASLLVVVCKCHYDLDKSGNSLAGMTGYWIPAYFDPDEVGISVWFDPNLSLPGLFRAIQRNERYRLHHEHQ